MPNGFRISHYITIPIFQLVPEGDSLGACGWTDGEFSIPSFDGDAAGTGGIGGVI